jgi:hypothetical protein
LLLVIRLLLLLRVLLLLLVIRLLLLLRVLLLLLGVGLLVIRLLLRLLRGLLLRGLLLRGLLLRGLLLAVRRRLWLRCCIGLRIGRLGRLLLIRSVSRPRGVLGRGFLALAG